MHYDLNDPFIDDSDLAIDERSFFAQTKQTGFYVSSGEVVLLKEKTPKKPKSYKPPPTQPLHLPVADDERVRLKRKVEEEEGMLSWGPGPSEAPSAGEPDKKKRKKGEIVILPFHPELHDAIEELKARIAQGTC